MIISKCYYKVKYFFLFLCVLFLSNCNDQIDLLVHNAIVYTVDDYGNKKSSFAVNNGKFIAVGGSEILKKYSAKSIVDAKGLPIYPGFIDSHCHYLSLGVKQGELDLVGTNSFDEILVKLKKYSESGDKKVLIGRGWDQNDWEDKSLPTKKKLDILFPEIPVILTRVDGHAMLVNQKVLDLAGINLNTNIDGGEIIKKDNKITGVLIDSAMSFVRKIIPKKTIKEKTEALVNAQEIFFQKG